MDEKVETHIKETVKLGAESCCCAASSAWCKFSFFRSKDNTSKSESHQSTPTLPKDIKI